MAEPLGQIGPWNAGFQDIQHGVDEQTIVIGRSDSGADQQLAQKEFLQAQQRANSDEVQAARAAAAAGQKQIAEELREVTSLITGVVKEVRTMKQDILEEVDRRNDRRYLEGGFR